MCKPKRSCYNCDYQNVCVVKHNISKSITLVKMNIDSDDLPLQTSDIFIAVANCCFEYKPINK